MTSSRQGENIANDIMTIGVPKRYVLVGIDYFTRALYDEILDEKTTKKVIKAFKKFSSIAKYQR